ncbi:ricin-type beta-trefoil lectin domain protein [Actinosynnema sp. CS-041913]|uniref:ricin-type beta-trefoil lectin domain protein n=1 Tax=Actinosynnema sp. CS-041913 TaxID=3239917 RepID=UPI003D91ECF0
MKFKRILGAVAMAASALLIAPTSNADHLDAPQDEWELESVARPGDVWDQTNWAWDPQYPIIAHPRHGEDNQTWFISDDGTIKNKKYGWCATSIDGKLAGRPCGSVGNQKWKGKSPDGYHSWQFELDNTGLCVTHNGVYKELILTRCESERRDQRWIIHKR